MARKFVLFLGVFIIAMCTSGKELKGLMIGNSFSQSVLTYLPKIVESEGKHKLLLAQLFIGGCTLEQHIQELSSAEKDPAHKPYYTNYPYGKDSNYSKMHRTNLPALIGAEKWDFVTIQQGSHESWRKDRTQPFADKLIAYIRQHAPQAEILIHQTWSYRCDSPKIGGESPEWGIDQTEMYRRLTENYQALADQYGFRIIPVGKAVQEFRKLTPVKFIPCTPAGRATYSPPDLPRQAGDVVGVDVWRKDENSGEMKISTDYIHLNSAGAYLQACVWYGFLFGENPEEIQFIPSMMGLSTANLLQTCAQIALQ